jgi:Fe-S oxidoreductase
VRRGYKELAQKIAAKRLKEVPPGTDYIVTACPMCNSNLEDAAGFSGAKPGAKVIDICDLVLLSMNK